MPHLTEREKQIKKLAEDFTIETLGSVRPHKMCFTICYPLSEYLINNGIENYIVGGYTNNIQSHFWLKLKENEEIIIDPTAKQVDESLPFLHFGISPKEHNYLENYVLRNPHKDVNFNYNFTKWSEPLLNNKFSSEDATRLDIKTYFKIGVKAAIILINDIEQKNIKVDQRPVVSAYLECICTTKNKHYSNEDIVGFFLPNNLDFFLNICNSRDSTEDVKMDN